MVFKEYWLHNGDAGRQSYLDGTAVPVIDGEIYYVLGLNDVLIGCSTRYIDGQWQMKVVCNLDGLTQQQIDDLDAFMDGTNNTVIGIYPPQLLDPAITFVHVAEADETLSSMRADLIGRGLDRQCVIFNGDIFEYWTDVEYSQSQKNRLSAMWENRLVFK